MKKQLALAVIVALLAFPVGSSVALAETGTTATAAVDVTATGTTATDNSATTPTDQTTTTQTTTTNTTTTGDSGTTATSSGSTSSDSTATPSTGTTTTTVSGSATTDSGTAAPGTTTGTTTGTTGTTTSDGATTGTTAPAPGSATGTPLPPVQDGNGSTVQPGTQPDSPFYWLVQLVQKLELALTFDPVKKAAWLERHALQDLAAATKLAHDGKAEAAQKALDAYADKVTRATQFLDQLKDPNSPAAQVVVTALEKSNAANVAVLTGLLDKLPPQAAQRVALNVVKAMEKAVAKAEKAKKKEADAAAASTQGSGTGANGTNQTSGTPTASGATQATVTTPEDVKKLEAEAKSALARLKKALQNSASRHDNQVDQDEDKNDSQDEDNDEDNKVVRSDDPNQPAHTIGDEKKAAVAKGWEKGQQGANQSQANAQRPASAGHNQSKDHAGERDKGEQAKGRNH